MTIHFPATPPYFPTTFLERGVVVPFTTPMLVGSRVRVGERSGLELIVANPSGGRGVYILPWAALHEFAHPSLYDRSLQKAVAAIKNLSPTAMRRVTRNVAAEGLAGHDAKEAAKRATERDNEARGVTNASLVAALVREVMPSEAEPDLAASGRMAGLAIAKVAPRLGLSAEGVRRALDELAAIFIGVGLGPEASATARLPTTLARLVKLRDDLDRLIEQDGDDGGDTGKLVRSCASLTIACAGQTLSDARALAMHPAEMMVRWRSNPADAVAIVTRPEWVMDGWETICSIWEAAHNQPSRRAAMAKIAQLAPVVPREASEWVSTFDVEAASVTLFRRLVRLNHDWRSGENALFAQARNEELLADVH